MPCFELLAVDAVSRIVPRNSIIGNPLLVHQNGQEKICFIPVFSFNIVLSGIYKTTSSNDQIKCLDGNVDYLTCSCSLLKEPAQEDVYEIEKRIHQSIEPPLWQKIS